MEMLQIIVLACQVSTGMAGNGYELVDKYQKKCQKKLIKCIEKKQKKNLNTNYVQIKECLLER